MNNIQDFREVASLQTKSIEFQQHAEVLTPNHIALQDVALLTHFREMRNYLLGQIHLLYTSGRKSSSSQI